MTNYSRQCVLVNAAKNSNKVQVSWIPEKFAVVGKVLRIKEGNNWEDGWEVVSVGGRLDSKTVNKNSQLYKNHRKDTDI